MVQQICFVHIRLCIASGHVVPDITFKYSDTEKSKNTYLIELDKLDENDLRETLLKLKGFRYDRDLIVETYSAVELKKMNENIESKSSSPKPKSSDKKLSSKAALGKNKDHTKRVHESYAACVGGTSKKYESIQNNHELKQKSKQLKDKSESNIELDQKIPAKSESISERLLSADSQIDQNSKSKYSLSSVQFFSGNPAVDITNGIIHLYKTNFKHPVGEDVTPPSTNTLCMLSVPASIDTHSLLEFTAPYIEVLQQMRIIRDRTPNQYMVLLTFVSEKHASEFFLNLNNQPFSSLIPEDVCHLAFVASVEALAPPGRDEVAKDERFLPIPNSTELPDCMVCLERMDESVQGLLTVLCNHSFHATCLQKWEDLCCPVCRYVQTPEPRSDNKCMVCGASEDLWICLVCGHVGCGRYTKEHAQRHYLETYHNYAMSLTDNRVWDYAGDYFVHRLVQNKDDGKLVEKNTNEEHEAKLESVQLECMHLLTSQLESQRKYWEEQVAKAEKTANEERKDATKQLQLVVEKNTEIETEIALLEKEKKSLFHRNENLTARLRDALRDLSNEREMNKSLAQNQNAWKEKVRELEERSAKQEIELKDLKEQLRDLMFYIEASQKIKNENDAVQGELRDGQVVVGPPASSSESGRPRGKTKRKGR